ncbi:MAG: hypothetical protein AB1472_04950 [Candidatus Omnitrophota bacterium]
MKKILLMGLVINLATIFILTKEGFADRRSYVWTYEYMTMPKGAWELEHYLTSEIPDINRSNINTLKEWLELEYGITNNWDVAVYQMWKFNNKRFENDSEYDGFKIRTRYRFGQKGRFIVDPLIYVEYIRDDNFHKPNIIETKLILAKDIGNFNISYNQIAKRNLEQKGKTDHEYATGITYRIFSNFKLGMESKGNYSKEKYALGPTISWAGRRFWISLGAAFGLNKKTDDIQTRMIIGVNF